MDPTDLDRFAAVVDRDAPGRLMDGQVAFRWLLADPTGRAPVWPDTDIFVTHTPDMADAYLAVVQTQPLVFARSRHVAGLALTWASPHGTPVTVVMDHTATCRVARRPNGGGLAVAPPDGPSMALLREPEGPPVARLVLRATRVVRRVVSARN